MFNGNLNDDEDDKVWEDLMGEVDKNGDNVISPEEFTNVMLDIVKK